VLMRQIHASNDAFVPPTPPMDAVEREDYLILPGGHSSLVVAPHFYEAVVEFLDRPERPDPGQLQEPPTVVDEQGHQMPELKLLAGGAA
jgi:hypothetical protein